MRLAILATLWWWSVLSLRAPSRQQQQQQLGRVRGGASSNDGDDDGDDTLWPPTGVNAADDGDDDEDIDDDSKWPNEDDERGDDDDDDDDEDDEEARAAKAAKRWTARAFDAAKRGRSRLAMRAFERALQSTPEDAPYRAALLINAGSFLAFSGAPQKALVPLREAASLAPDDARALHALGNALHQCDAPNDALEVYVRALQVAPSRDFPPNAPLLNNVATILLARGEREHAATALEQSLEIEPRAPGTLFNLAMARFSEALDADATNLPANSAVVKSTGVKLSIDARLSAPHQAPKDVGALKRIIELLDRAEPHSPADSALRERVLALRGVAAARIRGRELGAIRDLRDVLEHGQEHRRDSRRRAAALCEIAEAHAHLGEFGEEMSALKAALKALESTPNKQPQDTRLLLGDAYSSSSDALEIMSSSSSSLALAARAVGGTAIRSRALLLMGGALARDPKNFAEALKVFAKAAEAGAGGSEALLASPCAAALRNFAPRRFDRIIKAMTRNDARAALDAFLRALKRAAADNNTTTTTTR